MLAEGHECHDFLVQAHAGIGEVTGVPQISLDDGWFSQMAVISIPLELSEGLHNTLKDEFGIQVPVTRSGNYSFRRVSLQAYNTQADVHRLVEAIMALA